MARRYDQGVIVGEPDPPKTLPEIAKWCHDEWELARKKRDGEHPAGLASRAYLTARAEVLSEVLYMFGTLGMGD